MTAPTFVMSLAQFGDRVALADDHGTTLTYSELAKRVDALAESLGSDRRLVMVELASSIPSVIAYLAALRGGHPAIIAKPGDVSGQGGIYAHFRPSAVHVAGADGFSVVHDEETELHPDLCAMYSTSGSTGSAKLVRLSARNIQANADSIAQYLEIDEHEIAPTTLPLSYSFGASILNSHLSRGARVVLTEYSVVDPEFATLFERENCTSLSGVPYTWELIEQVGFLNRDWPSLKTLTQAGGKMPASRVLRLGSWARDHGARLIVMYGQTECTARMSYLPWEHTLEHPDCIGVAIPDGEFQLVDEQGQTIDGPGMQGELVYTGPNVMMGYASQREELALASGPEIRHTGDLAERNEVGLYRIVGRLSRFSKIMGLRISLDEVEAIATRAGAESPVVAGNDEILAICIRSGSVDPSSLEADVSTTCSIPRDAVVVVEVEDEIPRLHNGKIDYVTIIERALEIAGARENDHAGLRDELSGLLGRTTLEDHESFSSLGGDSLTYIQASFAIERRLGHLPDKWEQLSIQTLEAYESGALHASSAGVGADDSKPTRMVAVDMDVLLRAIAITAVVYNHSRPTGMPPIPGAMATLLLAVGQNLARFRSDSLFRGESLELVRSTFTRYMLPYLAILVAYLLAKGKFDLPSLLLVSTFVDRRAGSFLEPFWFIEVFFHVMIVLAIVFSIPALRNSIAARPFGWGAGTLATLGAIHFASNQTGVELPPIVLWSGIVALGWCIHFADSQRDRVLLSLTALALPWLVPRGSAVAVVLIILIWLPRARLVFEPLKQLVGRVGAASFQIYIVHAVVLTLIGTLPGMRGGWVFPLVGIPLSLLAGVVLSMLPTLRARLQGRTDPASSSRPEAI